VAGPLAGLKVVELAGVGPAPHASMVLADLGADVARVDRPGGSPNAVGGPDDPADPLLRGRRLVCLDLKDPAGRATALRLIEAADVLVEGYRPGVLERLGLGPDECRARNPRLIYARMSGWGQTGPLAQAAGHDINYISLTGALHATGPAEQPVPPLNLVGDFGGGSMLLLVGVLSALWERERSGTGQVLDVAMVDGASLILQMIWSWREKGLWSDVRGANMLDGGAPYYRTYRCADDAFVAVGAIEAPFYARLLSGLGLSAADLPEQNDRAGWPLLHKTFSEVFASRTRDEWTAVFYGTDACVTPVLAFGEVTGDPHMAARGTVGSEGSLGSDGSEGSDGGPRAAPAPRFSRTAAAMPRRPVPADAETVLRDWAAPPS
jgi:alpha-methylacyl-CoA racemase